MNTQVNARLTLESGTRDFPRPTEGEGIRCRFTDRPYSQVTGQRGDGFVNGPVAFCI